MPNRTCVPGFPHPVNLLSVEEHSMHSPVSLLLWFTPAIAVATLTYPLLPIRRFRKRLFMNPARSVSRSSASLRIVPKPARRQRRSIEWISFKEFRSLLDQASDDLVVLDLRYDVRQVPFPIAEAFVLPVSPIELLEILAWLPPNRSVVLYGADAISIAGIERSPCMEGSAPIYFLAGNINRLESA
jgi:hypothetical protein